MQSVQFQSWLWKMDRRAKKWRKIRIDFVVVPEMSPQWKWFYFSSLRKSFIYFLKTSSSFSSPLDSYLWCEHKFEIVSLWLFAICLYLVDGSAYGWQAIFLRFLFLAIDAAVERYGILYEQWMCSVRDHWFC